MNKSNTFQREFNPFYGKSVKVAENLHRITCNNSGPFTYKGTNSYIVGTRTLAVIDPGPDDEGHFGVLMDTIGSRPVSHIFVTHTHMDHSPLARRLREVTGAKLVGAAPHHTARPLHLGEINPLDASADRQYEPDKVLHDGDTINGDGWTIETVETPGHTANHLAFALKEDGTLFSGDHIMAWATTIVAPPDGSMSTYMESLEKLLIREDRIYLPGHGGAVNDPHAFVRGIRGHRKMRERAIVERISKGDQTIEAMVREIYRDTDPRLHGAAALSVFAHLEHLIAQGRASTEGTPSLESRFFLQ